MTLKFIQRNHFRKLQFITVIVGFLAFIVLRFYSDDMTASSTRQYNLRSNGPEMIQLPVELQVAEDSTFMKDLLASQKTSVSGQVSDNDSSIHESDCEALIASSHDEHDSCCKGSSQETYVKKPDLTMSDTQSTSQQTINILAQLQSLGTRLDAMEKEACKKSVDSTKVKNKNIKPKTKSQTVVTPPPVHQSSGLTDLQSLRQDVNL